MFVAGPRLLRPLLQQLLRPFAALQLPRDAVAPGADAVQPFAGDDGAAQLLPLPLPPVVASSADAAAANGVAVREASSQCPRWAAGVRSVCWRRRG